jgi:hypothetical protein
MNIGEFIIFEVLEINSINSMWMARQRGAVKRNFNNDLSKDSAMGQAFN